MKKVKLSILLVLYYSCSILDENSSSYTQDYYVEYGWEAFEEKKYDLAETRFKTAIETNESGSLHYFKASIGMGWTYIQKALDIQEIEHDGYISLAGNYLYQAYELTSWSSSSSSKENLYAGLCFQRSYWAKQQIAMGILVDTLDTNKNSYIRDLYEESKEFSMQISPYYIFEHDTTFNYEDFLLIGIESDIFLGNLQDAVNTITNYDSFNTYNCVNGLDEDSVIECYCIILNNGGCPFTSN